MHAKPFPIALLLALLCNTSCVQKPPASVTNNVVVVLPGAQQVKAGEVKKPNAIANPQKASVPSTPSPATKPASVAAAGNKPSSKVANTGSAITSGQKKAPAPQAAAPPTVKAKANTGNKDIPSKAASAAKATPSKAAPSTASSTQSPGAAPSGTGSTGASSQGAAKTPQAPAAKTKPAITEERTTNTKTVVDVVPVAAPDSELREP